MMSRSASPTYKQSAGSTFSASAAASKGSGCGLVFAVVSPQMTATVRVDSANRAGIVALCVTTKAHDVVDRRVGFEPVGLGKGVVGHADQRVRLEAGAARKGGDFRRLQEPGVVVRAARQEPEHVLRADDRQRV